jgi:hypothetical protein
MVVLKPNRNSFIEKMAKHLDEEMSVENQIVLSNELYNVLFDVNLSQLTTTQVSLLSVLLNSENPDESVNVFKAISQIIPDTKPYLLNLYKHKVFLPNKEIKSKEDKDNTEQKELFNATLEEDKKAILEEYNKKTVFIQ